MFFSEVSAGVIMCPFFADDIEYDSAEILVVYLQWWSDDKIVRELTKRKKNVKHNLRFYIIVWICDIYDFLNMQW